MVWSLTQRERLAIEKATLEQYFRLGVTWIDPRHETKVEILLKSNSDKEYKLRIYIPADFPNSCPALVVVQPRSFCSRTVLDFPKAALLSIHCQIRTAFIAFVTFIRMSGHKIPHYIKSSWKVLSTFYYWFDFCIPGFRRYICSRLAVTSRQLSTQYRIVDTSVKNIELHLSHLYLPTR
jgi:hypothetical protein